MSKIAVSTINQLATSRVDTLIHEALKLPQVSCGISHFFGPGIYIKEARVPAGTCAIGQIHKVACTNVLIKGRVSVINCDQTTTEFVAPMTFVSYPGQKIGYFHEDTIWQNIYATDETDIEKLEEMLIYKNQELKSLNSEKLNAIDVSECKADYELLLQERNLTEQQARAIVENHTDLIALPTGSYKFIISDSPIEGKGLFATSDIAAGEVIAPARIGNSRTPAGRYTNHSNKPNSFPRLNQFGSIDLVANTLIKGSTGGTIGEEITVNYRQSSTESNLLDKELECHHS